MHEVDFGLVFASLTESICIFVTNCCNASIKASLLFSNFVLFMYYGTYFHNATIGESSFHRTLAWTSEFCKCALEIFPLK